MFKKANNHVGNSRIIAKECIEEDQPDTKYLSLITEDNIRSRQWTKQIHFTLCMISSTFSVAGIWRFPFMCATRGGLAFIVIYSLSYLIA